METKICISCGYDKPLDQFRMRKTPPIQLYKFCDSCVIIARRGKDTKAEYDQLREKAKQLRCFNEQQDIEIYKRVEAGTTRRDIAKEYSVSNNAVGKAYFRGRRALHKANA